MDVLKPYLGLIYALLTAAALFALVGMGWNLGSSHVQVKWDRERAEQAKADKAANDANNNKIHDLEVQNDKIKDKVVSFAADNRSLRLLLSKAACNGPAAADDGGHDSTTGAEPLSGVSQAGAGGGAVEDGPQSAIDGYVEWNKKAALECDLVVNDCRTVVDWAKSLRDKIEVK